MGALQNRDSGPLPCPSPLTPLPPGLPPGVVVSAPPRKQVGGRGWGPLSLLDLFASATSIPSCIPPCLPWTPGERKEKGSLSLGALASPPWCPPKWPLASVPVFLQVSLHPRLLCLQPVLRATSFLFVGLLFTTSCSLAVSFCLSHLSICLPVYSPPISGA